MKTKWVITVGREFCSGGAETARKVAERLEIPYYDKAIIDETVESTQLAAEIVAHHDERPITYSDITGFQYGGLWYHEDPSLPLPVGMRVADAQFDVIRKAANRSPCVIVGRCADYVLEERKNVLNVFIRASMEYRVKRAMDLYGLVEGDARKLIRKTDKIRANYYRYYAQRNWGDPANHELIIDAGKLGTDGAACVIAAYAEQFTPQG